MSFIGALPAKRVSVFMNTSEMDKSSSENNISFLPKLKQLHEERVYKQERDPKVHAAKLQNALQSTVRSEFEARLLYEQIKDFPFFQNFNQRNKGSHFESQAFINICKKMKFEKYPAGTVLFKEGDEPNGKMYVVYDGEVAIVIKENDFYAKQSLLAQKKQSQEDEELEEKPDLQKVAASKAQKTFLTMMENVNQLTRTQSIPRITVNDTERKENIRSLERYSSMVIQESIVLDDEQDENPPQETHQPSRRSKWNVVRDSHRFKTRLVVPKMHDKSHLEKLPKTMHTLDRSGASSQKSMVDIMAEERRKKEEAMVNSLIAAHGNLKDTVTKGYFFGELALFDDTKRTATVITMTDCELLCIEKEEFSAIRSSFDRKKRIVQRFMTKYFPDLENLNTFSIVQGLMYLLEEKLMDYGAYLAKEGEMGKKFYIIYEGACEITKSIRIDQSCQMDSEICKIKNYLRVGPVQKIDIPICKTETGVFVSDEILFTKDPIYQFSVKTCTPQTVVFQIDRDKFLKRFPAAVLSELQKANKHKLSGHQLIFKHMLKSRYPGTHMVTDPDIPFFEQQVTIILAQTERTKLNYVVAEQSKTSVTEPSEDHPGEAESARLSTEQSSEQKRLVRSNLLKQGFLHGLPEKQVEKNLAFEGLRKSSAPNIKMVASVIEAGHSAIRSPSKEVDKPLMNSVLDYKFLTEEEMRVQKHRLACIIQKHRSVQDQEIPSQPHFITPRLDQMIKRIKRSHSKNDISLSQYKDATMLTAARVTQTNPEESFAIDDKDIIKHLLDDNGDQSSRKTRTESSPSSKKLKIKVTTKGAVYPKVDLLATNNSDKFFSTKRSDMNFSPDYADQPKRVDMKSYQLFNTMLKRKHRFNSKVKKRNLHFENSEFLSFEKITM